MASKCSPAGILWVVLIRLTPLAPYVVCTDASARLPQDVGAVPTALRKRGGVPGLLGGVPLAGRLPLPEVSARRGSRVARTPPLAMPGLRVRHVGHRGHRPPSDADAPYAVVLGCLSRDHSHPRRVGSPAPAPAGHPALRDRVGDAAQAEARDGTAGA